MSQNESNLDLAHRPVVGSTSGGQPLPEPILHQIESQSGVDLGDVRVHVGHPMPVQLNAQAYARGNDIFFAPGAYDPGSPQGREVIAHEAWHVVQQKQGRVKPTLQA